MPLGLNFQEQYPDTAVSVADMNLEFKVDLIARIFDILYGGQISNHEVFTVTE